MSAPATTKDKNLTRLREASSNLLSAVGRDENKAAEILPFVQAVTQKLMSIYVPNQIYPKGPFDLPSELLVPPSRETLDERTRIAKRLFGFNPKDNYVIKEIAKRFGGAIKQGELIGIASAIAEKANLKLDRDAKRRKNVLIRWFDENWETVGPLLDYVVLEDVQCEEEDKLSEHENSPEIVTTTAVAPPPPQPVPVPRVTPQIALPPPPALPPASLLVPEAPIVPMKKNKSARYIPIDQNTMIY